MASSHEAREGAPHPLPKKPQEHAVRAVGAEHSVGSIGNRTPHGEATAVETIYVGQRTGCLRRSPAGPSPLHDRGTGSSTQLLSGVERSGENGEASGTRDGPRTASTRNVSTVLEGTAGVEAVVSQGSPFPVDDVGHGIQSRRHFRPEKERRVAQLNNPIRRHSGPRSGAEGWEGNTLSRNVPASVNVAPGGSRRAPSGDVSGFGPPSFVSGQRAAQGLHPISTSQGEPGVSPAIGSQRGDPPPGPTGAQRGRPDAPDGSHSTGDAVPLSRTWPPNNAGGRSSAGRRRPSPPPVAEQLGHKAPSVKQLGVDLNRLYLEVQRLSGNPNPAPLPDRRHWRLHLKNNTPLNAAAVFALPTAREKTIPYLESAWKFMEPSRYEGMMTSRSLKSTQLSQAEIDEAVRMGKFEECMTSQQTGSRLPYGWHGVNVFTVPELKGRRRLITEPLVNACINRKTLPKLSYPTRLGRRQALRNAHYMLQIDFEAFYDAIPLPESIRNNFVFRKGNRYFRLRTLPTGGCWSVAVGQAVTWTIVDIDTPCIIYTMIDNILIAGFDGQEHAFTEAVRSIVGRIKAANLMTSPDRDTLESASDEEILRMGSEPNTFLGEEYVWSGGERLIRNSVKTIAKLNLALEAQEFTCRSFVSLVSLILYALHTTKLNPAGAFKLLRAYRGVYRTINEDIYWDSPLPYLDPTVHAKMLQIGQSLCQNQLWQIAEPLTCNFEDSHYDHIVVSDASYGGWGAYVYSRQLGRITGYQQRWEHKSFFDDDDYHPDDVQKKGYFDAHHSAHAEPRAAELVLRTLIQEGLSDGAKVAFMTDHDAIHRAQRRANGFGGIGRGYALNKLFEFVYDLWHQHHIEVTFFWLQGKVNPADTISRVFGGPDDYFGVYIFPSPYTQIPLLRSTCCNVCEDLLKAEEEKKRDN